jgi:6-phospho-3-hexuloisomerase
MDIATRMRNGARQAAAEIEAAVGRIDPAEIEALCAEILAARRIALHGLGREGLMMKGLAMRLYHLGLDAHVVGEMTTPPVGTGDLLLVCAGPGHFASILALVEIARGAGARSLCITAQPRAAVPRACDGVLTIPAQTMADDTAPRTGSGPASLLPMGSLYEGALFLLFELMILELRRRTGASAQEMRARHTNLE